MMSRVSLDTSLGEVRGSWFFPPAWEITSVREISTVHNPVLAADAHREILPAIS